MKRISAVLGALLVFAMFLSLAGCGKKEENSLVGTWEYSDTESGIGADYVLKDDGTGTYTMKVGETEITYELKYEVKDGHLLVRYVNNEIFTEDDVFDNEFSFRDAKTLIVKDTLGEELPFIRK